MVPIGAHCGIILLPATASPRQAVSVEVAAVERHQELALPGDVPQEAQGAGPHQRAVAGEHQQLPGHPPAPTVYILLQKVKF